MMTPIPPAHSRDARRWIRLAPALAALGAFGVALIVAATPGHDRARVGAAAALGVALLAVHALVHRDAWRAWLRRRAARQGAASVVSVLTFLAVVALVQAIALEVRGRFDLTRDAEWTLAPQTRAVLDALTRDVRLVACFRHGSDAELDARSLLDLYAFASDRIRVEFLDPDREPGRAEDLGVRPGQVVVIAGPRRRIARRAAEADVTSAILQATRERQRAIYVVTGHGEKAIDENDRGGWSAARRALEGQGYAVRPLSLLGVERAPDDAALLVLAGPRRALLPDEVNVLERFLRAGGGVFVLMDPRRDDAALFEMLARWRVALDPVVLLDELVLVGTGRLRFDATVTKVRTYGRHPVVRRFDEITMYPRARPVRITAPAGPDSIDAAYLAWTGRSAWGETDLESVARGHATRDADDVPPPLPVAAALERVRRPGEPRDLPRGRMIVVGDSDFANNAFFGVLGNGDFFLNCVSWLCGDEGLIGVRARGRRGDRIVLEAGQQRLLFLVCVVLPPILIGIVGAFVVVRRRRRT